MLKNQKISWRSARALTRSSQSRRRPWRSHGLSERHEEARGSLKAMKKPGALWMPWRSQGLSERPPITVSGPLSLPHCVSWPLGSLWMFAFLTPVLSPQECQKLYSAPTRMATVKNQTNKQKVKNRSWWGWGGNGTLGGHWREHQRGTVTLEYRMAVPCSWVGAQKNWSRTSANMCRIISLTAPSWWAEGGSNPSVHWQMNGKTKRSVYIHTREYYSAFKGKEILAHAMNQEDTTLSEIRQSHTKNPTNTVWFPLCELRRVVKFIESENRVEDARSCGGGMCWVYCLMDTEFQFGKMKKVLVVDRVRRGENCTKIPII